MFKNTKIINAAIMSMFCTVMWSVPVIAATNDYQTVDVKEDTIYKARAFGNGNFYIDGEINGADSAAYYLSNGQYKKLDKIESGDDLGMKYLTGKYLEIDDGDYYLNTLTGEITEDSIKDELEQDIIKNVRKKIKKDDNGRFNSSCFNDNLIKADRLANGTIFMNDWSQFKYKLKTSHIDGINNDGNEIIKDYSTICTNIEGEYIDADYNLGKIKVYTTTGASVIIKNTEDTYEIKDNGKTYELKAEVTNPNIVTVGFNSIFRTSDLTIYRKEKDESDDAYIPVTSELRFGDKDNPMSTDGDSIKVIQVISKAQSSDDIDGIKYAKDVKTYFITDSDGNTESLFGLGDVSELSNVSSKAGIPILTSNGSNIISCFFDAKGKELYGQTVNLKSKNGYCYTDVSDFDKTDVDSFNGISTVGAKVTCISKGYIKQWDNEESFKKLNKIDGGMSNINFIDDNNIIVWNEDDGVCSIIANVVPKQETINANPETNILENSNNKKNKGWILNELGNWNYILDNGNKIKGWLQDSTNGLWYYMDVEGKMLNNRWMDSKGNWYYLKDDGSMATGWIHDNGNWYYLSTSGIMLSNINVNGYTLGSDGSWIK